MDRAIAADHLDVVPELGHFSDERKKIVSIDAQNVNRGAAAHRCRTLSSFRERGFTETVARLQNSQRDLGSVRFHFDRARAAVSQNVKGVRRIVLAHNRIAKIVAFLLQQRFERAEMLVRKESKSRGPADDLYVLRLHCSGSSNRV